MYTVEGNQTLYAYWLSVPTIPGLERDNGDITAVVVCDDAQAVIFCVTYRDNGQMVSVASEAVGETSNHTFRFPNAAYDYALVFVADGDCVPLCEPKRT